MSSEAIRVIRLSILGSVAILPILILPTMIGALIDYTGFSESEAGWIAAAGFTGSALGAIAVGLRIRHLDPQKLTLVGLLVLGTFDLSSAFVSHLPVWVFVAVRLISGLGGAMIYAAVVASLASTKNPERGFGVFMVLQFGLSAVGLYGLPYALPNIGVVGMYLILGTFAFAALMLKDSVVHREKAAVEAAIEIHTLMKPAAIFIMFGIGLYETANFMQYTYSERIGIGFGLSNFETGEALGIASLLGVPAALIVVWIGDRFGQLRPLLAAIILSAVAHLLLLMPTGAVSYYLAVYILGGAWAVGLAYFYAIEARLDPGGSIVVVGGFFTSCGSVAGPALAAMLVQPDEFGSVIAVAIGVYVLAGVLAMVSVYVGTKN
jgi:MFS family permease